MEAPPGTPGTEAVVKRAWIPRRHRRFRGRMVIDTSHPWLDSMWEEKVLDSMYDLASLHVVDVILGRCSRAAKAPG